jgi:hypothetical protein
MKKLVLSLMPLMAALPLAAQNFRATLDGYAEAPAVSTPGKGAFRATLNADGTSLAYELEYSGLRAGASAAHVHFGREATNGGVLFWLCGGGGKPACPGVGGSVSGTIVTGDIQAIAGQGIAAGDFAAALAAMRAGATYVNVHTSLFPGGEIRGQIRPGIAPRLPEPAPGGGQGQQKVKVCHYVKSEKAWTTIEVAEPAVPAHLKQGGCLAKPTDVVGQPCTCP